LHFVGWVEERNPTKDIGMLNPTYDCTPVRQRRGGNQHIFDADGLAGFSQICENISFKFQGS
jgi:hypothetical protein